MMVSSSANYHGGSGGGGGTPSKKKVEQGISRTRSGSGTPTKTTSTSTGRSSSSNTHSTFWKTLRWILFGFGVGAASMALFHSVTMPRIRIELEYADAPRVMHHKKLSTILGSSKHNKNKKKQMKNLNKYYNDVTDVVAADAMTDDDATSVLQQQQQQQQQQEQPGEEEDDEEERQEIALVAAAAAAAERDSNDEPSPKEMLELDDLDNVMTEDSTENEHEKENEGDDDTAEAAVEADNAAADDDTAEAAANEDADADEDKDDDDNHEKENDQDQEQKQKGLDDGKVEDDHVQADTDHDHDQADHDHDEADADHDEDTRHKAAPVLNPLNNRTYIQAEMIPEPDDPDFSNPGPPPKLDAGEAFAACILIKDDNHWLIEWLAYHYHVMPLRYLIVAVDPDSKTTPIPILRRWKDRKLMNIGIWNDTHFMPSKVKANPKNFDNNTELMWHRVRQNNFYFKCMKTFKTRNREWLMLIDTDEYIVVNYASGLYYNMTKNIPITKPGNVLTFIKQHHMLTGENHTCSYMPRYMFGVKETSPDMLQRHMPAGWNGSHFLTQRFMYRNPRRMHNGKNLINIRKLPAIKTYTSVHHVSSYCPDPDKMRTVNHVKKALVRVHHYLGTEEQYFFRSDPRAHKPKNVTEAAPTPAPTAPPAAQGIDDDPSALVNNTNTTNTTKAKAKAKKQSSLTAYFTRGKGRYEMLNKRADYPDQGARAWIRGFIEDVGMETAKLLLEGVGQVGYE